MRGPIPNKSSQEVSEDVLHWVESKLPMKHDVIRVQPLLPRGFSNENFVIVAEHSGTFVLRRYLRPNVCSIEAAVMARLLDRNFPVPEVIALDVEGTISGSPLMLRRFIDGHVASDVVDRMSPYEASALGEAVGRTLAEIATVTFDAAGYFDGPDLVPIPDERLDNIPELISTCLDRIMDRESLTANERDRLSEIIEVYASLLEPRDGSVLVHGDFNLTNIVVSSAEERWSVKGVMDWEFALSGSPLYDVGTVLRIRNMLHPSFATHFLMGYSASGGHLPQDSDNLHVLLDFSALVAECLTRDPRHLFLGEEADFVRSRLLGQPPQEEG